MPASTAPPDGPLPLFAGMSGPRLPGQRPAPAPRPPRPVRLLPVAAVLLLSGLLLATAFGAARRDAPDLSRQRTAIETQVAARQQAVAGLQTARLRLRQQIAAARTAAVTLSAASSTATTDLSRLAPVAGTVAVTGPGVTVTLTDPAGTQRSARRITDTDVVAVVNVLWAGGAEAVAVNGDRLTARTAIRSAGDAVLVNFRPLASPYRVTAVGPASLATAFASSAVAARLRTAAAVYGSGLSVRVDNRLRLPAASGLRTVVARPAGPGPAASTGAAP